MGVSSFLSALNEKKKDVSLVVKRLPFCGCQDSNLEPFGS